jgi:hypothetical protein
MSLAGRMPIMYYGNEAKVVEVAGYGVKVMVNDKGHWYYSVQDMLVAAGEDFARKVYQRLVDHGVESHIMRYPESKFYYGDLKAIEVLLTQVVGTDRAKTVYESIRMR